VKEKIKTERKFCGNCSSHNAYNYPSRIFCSLRFFQNKDPIVETLWCCDSWNPSSQECHCVKDALKHQNNR